MAQKYLPEIKQGDKRILMIDGEPVPYALARIPMAGETRGNLAAGGRGEGRPLSERDRWICQQVGPTLREKGLLFVGLDVIGDYLTEINVTSPTCIRELDRQFDLDIGMRLMDRIEEVLTAR
jgi:glutathione synthase